MIICSCSGVTDRDIRQAITWMRASDPYALITPGEIYRALGKSAECGGCIRLCSYRVSGWWAGSWRRSVVMTDDARGMVLSILGARRYQQEGAGRDG